MCYRFSALSSHPKWPPVAINKITGGGRCRAHTEPIFFFYLGQPLGLFPKTTKLLLLAYGSLAAGVAIISCKHGCVIDAVPLYQYTLVGTHFADLGRMTG